MNSLKKSNGYEMNLRDGQEVVVHAVVVINMAEMILFKDYILENLRDIKKIVNYILH